MSTSPEVFKSKFILWATLKAKPGKGDEVQEKLATIRAFAESSAAPKTLTYRTTRYGDDFAIFEEYAEPSGLVEHKASAEFKALIELSDKLLEGPPTVHFFEEFV
ncbi:antibiotic biosynthesis monooxygenase [Pyrrhoderma noxium]|uniref:Antibiotic biosynthesis monooxygenase n=1 Tax=Pyrrhoderma noxium TaxID=2282107 RepID=A0A286UR03_9AGAM|nr:antibiotic biosynthesis monooxygenase [Pyrrhoderma noxium]